MNLANLMTLLGLAENVIPLFVHNPNSQKIEAVVFTTAESIINHLQTQVAPNPVANVPANQTININKQ